MVEEHCSNYQRRDLDVVDYQMYQLSGTKLWFRGPEFNRRKNPSYFTCVGAAQTFGCFCRNPYPAMLSSRLGMAALNLGYGGAGPRFFDRIPELIDYMNNGRFVIVQVMSGRSEDNSQFSSGGSEYLTRRSDGKKMSADDAWRSILETRYLWNKVPIGKFALRRICRMIGTKRARILVAETRENWCDSYERLLSKITVPVILFWFSKRQPAYEPVYSDLQTLFGDFPQLVNEKMIDRIRRATSYYVECTTSRGSPQPLFHRKTGEPVQIDLSRDREDFKGRVWTENAYYPSPEMQEDAADAIESTCKDLIAVKLNG